MVLRGGAEVRYVAFALQAWPGFSYTASSTDFLKGKNVHHKAGERLRFSSMWTKPSGRTAGQTGPSMPFPESGMPTAT